MKQESKLVYSVIEMAEVLGIGRSTAYELVRSGAVPSLQLGRRIVIPKRALGQLLAQCASQSADGPDQQSDKSTARRPW